MERFFYVGDDVMVSIIVPIYNTSEYLKKCLTSITKQTYSNIEIILVDDGSTDESGSICDDFAREDDRICVIHKNNEGLVRARKDGLKKSSGEYVTYVDGDDWIESDMVRHLVDVMDTQRVDVVIHGRFFDINEKSIENKQGFPEGRYDRKDIINTILPGLIVNQGFMAWGIYPNVWDKLFKREVLYDSQMEVDDVLTMGEDAACVYPCLLKAESIYISDKCFYHYRQNNTSMVRSRVTGKNENYIYTTLYYSVKRILDKYSYLYDLNVQWRDYLLFLMIPRADVLYEGYDKLDYLFPYPAIKRNSKVVIYGAGVYGKRLYSYLKETRFCDVVGIVDRDYQNLSTTDFDVKAPTMISSMKFDYIIVAISFEKVRNTVCTYLNGIIEAEKIQTMDMDLVRSAETWKAFNLNIDEDVRK